MIFSFFIKECKLLLGIIIRSKIFLLHLKQERIHIVVNNIISHLQYQLGQVDIHQIIIDLLFY